MDHALQSEVSRALGATGDRQLEMIGSLQTAEQLHQFMLNYNINDGVDPVFAVLANPRCDVGTALYSYWLCWPGFDDLRPRGQPDPAFDFDALRREIAQRLESDGFGSSHIFFDPAADFSRVQLYKLRSLGAKYLDPVGAERVERLWL